MARACRARGACCLATRRFARWNCGRNEAAVSAMRHVCGAVVLALLLTPFVDRVSGIGHSPIRSDAKVVAEILREQRDVVVDGAREHWRLVWKGKPHPPWSPDPAPPDRCLP